MGALGSPAGIVLVGVPLVVVSFRTGPSSTLKEADAEIEGHSFTQIVDT